MNDVSKTELKESKQEENIELELECPNCESKDIITDDIRGEKICSFCGVVVGARLISVGSDWRSCRQEEHEKRARTEFSNYRINHDLSTFIGMENKDALGKNLSPKMQSQFFRMRKWQVRIKSQESKDRNLNKANRELDLLCSKLDMHINLKIKAGELYKKSFESGVIRGYPIEHMVAASVYAAARIRRVPRTLDEISNSTQITKKRVAQCYRIIIKRMHFKIPLTKPTDFILRLGTELAFTSDVQQLATEIIREANTKKLTIGKDPSGFAASALYLAGLIKGKKINQSIIAKTAHVTEVTIRHRLKDLLSTIQIN